MALLALAIEVSCGVELGWRRPATVDGESINRVLLDRGHFGIIQGPRYRGIAAA